MIQYKVFYAHTDEHTEHDDSVRKFLNELSEVGHTLIRTNTAVYGVSSGYLNRLRTEIVYRENPTRKVIVEKNEH
jgi:hypothetical protein